MVTATDCWSARVLVFSATAACAALSVQTATASATWRSVRFMERPFLVGGQAINAAERKKGLAYRQRRRSPETHVNYAVNQFALGMPASGGAGACTSPRSTLPQCNTSTEGRTDTDSGSESPRVSRADRPLRSSRFRRYPSWTAAASRRAAALLSSPSAWAPVMGHGSGVRAEVPHTQDSCWQYRQRQPHPDRAWSAGEDEPGVRRLSGRGSRVLSRLCGVAQRLIGPPAPDRRRGPQPASSPPPPARRGSPPGGR